MKRLVVSTLTIMGFYLVQAQSERTVPINISYFGETITHPGLKVGVEYPLWTKSMDKEKRSGKVFPKSKQLFTTGNIGFYHQNRYHTGVFINSEIGYRKTKKKGFKSEALLGAGYIRTFLDGETYKVNANGEVKRVRHAGQSGFMPSISFGLGKDMGFAGKKNWAWHIRQSIYLQMPYNYSVLPHYALEVGITRSFADLNLKKQ